MPPSIEELERRLRSKSTDSEESMKRIGKASREMSAAPAFDVQIINDKLDRAVQVLFMLSNHFYRNDWKATSGKVGLYFGSLTLFILVI